MDQDIVVGQPSKRIHIDHKKYPVRIEGHRGAGFLEPENSIKAFKKAIELELEGVEFDVWLTKDYVPVVLHGYPGGIVEFAEGAKDIIGHFTSDEIRKFTLKNGQKIPTLEEVFDTCKDKVCLNIEVKEVKEEVVEKMLDLAVEKDILEQITFSSFNHYLRKKLTEEVERRGLKTKLTFGFLMRVTGPTLPDYQIETQPGDSLNLDIRYLERNRSECLEHIAKAKKAQMKIIFWFPMEYLHEDSFWEDLMKIGTDTIITNKPIELNEYFVAKQLGA